VKEAALAAGRWLCVERCWHYSPNLAGVVSRAFMFVEVGRTQSHLGHSATCPSSATAMPICMRYGAASIGQGEKRSKEKA